MLLLEFCLDNVAVWLKDSSMYTVGITITCESAIARVSRKRPDVEQSFARKWRENNALNEIVMLMWRERDLTMQPKHAWYCFGGRNDTVMSLSQFHDSIEMHWRPSNKLDSHLHGDEPHRMYLNRYLTGCFRV